MRRSGFVLVAVVVVVAAAILVATGAIFAARGATMSARAADFERRLRDAALDGVAIAADAVAESRDKILAGAAPQAEPMLLRVQDGARQFEVRLVPLAGGELFESEAAKLDINTAPPAAMEKVTESSSDLAREIVRAMGSRRPNSSVDASAALVAPAKGLDALREVLGPMRAVGDEREQVDDGGVRTRGADIPALVSLFTTLGAEPLVGNDGLPRLDLVAAFGDGAAEGPSTASLDRFEDAEREALAAMVKAAKGPLEDGAIARALVARGVDLPRIDEILGSTTLEEGTHGAPRVDIVRADVRVLAALDGIGADIASRIVDLRETLDETERRGTSWLVSRRVLTPEQYVAVAGRLTHRSALWRFRVEARVVAADDEEPSAETTESRGIAAFDCVVDVSPEDRRIAFLRDVSMLPTARALAAMRRNAEEEEGMPKTEDDGTDQDAEADASDPADGGLRDDSTLLPPPDPRPIDPPSRQETIGRPSQPERSPRGHVSPTGRDIGGTARP